MRQTTAEVTLSGGLESGKEHPFVLGVLGSAMHGPEALHVCMTIR